MKQERQEQAYAAFKIETFFRKGVCYIKLWNKHSVSMIHLQTNVQGWLLHARCHKIYEATTITMTKVQRTIAYDNCEKKLSSAAIVNNQNATILLKTDRIMNVSQFGLNDPKISRFQKQFTFCLPLSNLLGLA